jgi:hypothetical protein
MKVLLLYPKIYTLAETFKLGFIQNNCEVYHYDYRDNTNLFKEKIHTHIRKLPYKVRSRWYNYYANAINQRHIEVFKDYCPDLVIIYNSEMLLPETIVFFQKKAKVVFFLGDSPFYTPVNDNFFSCLTKADIILCADTGIIEQLKIIGLNQCHFFLIASNPEVNYQKDVTVEEKAKWGSDLVFVGASYSTSIGYKRALFLNNFADLDIKIYTSRMFRRWYSYFPKLEKKVIHPGKRISDDELNTILNCCKIYPIDANPGLINGIHLRILDCIASGILPMAEYRKDVVEIFGKAGLPIIDDYSKASSLGAYYLKNEKERLEIIEALRNEVKNYNPERSIQKFIEEIGF